MKAIMIVIVALLIGLGFAALFTWLLMSLVNWLLGSFGSNVVFTFWQTYAIVCIMSFVGYIMRSSITIKK